MKFRCYMPAGLLVLATPPTGCGAWLRDLAAVPGCCVWLLYP